MKLLIIARPFTVHGGVEHATVGLVSALAEHGHCVEVLTPGAPAAVRGATVRRLRVPPLGGAARLLGTAILARVAVRGGTWDVVQSHERTLSQDVYRAGEGCHRAYLANVPPPRGRRLYHRLVLALERRLFAITPRIVAIARTGRDEIARWYGVPAERLAVVYNGVDVARFHPENRERYRSPVRAAAGLAASDFVALFVGSGFARKGLAAAIEGLAGLADASRLVVVGKGEPRPYRALAARLGVADRVIWLGPRPDTERWYAAADVVVLPSLYEPFGNVHLEALAAGVPVVASRRAGGAEVITDGENGILVDPLDASAVTAALARLRTRRPDDLAQAARRAAEPFTFAAQVGGFEQVYRSQPSRPRS